MDATLLTGIISSAATLAGQGTNAAVTGKMNRKSMAFSRQMYDQQRKDNLAQWERVNEYNSPLSQMERYRQAGLNPALMYGNGGNSGQAASIPTPDVQSPQFRTPEWGNAISGAGLGISQYFDFEIKQAQIDNLRAQNDVIKQEAALKQAETKRVLSSGDMLDFDLGFKREFRGLSGDMMKENLRQTQTNIDLAVQRNAREIAQNSTSIQEAMERMLNYRQERENALIRQVRDKAEIARIRQDTRRMSIDTQNMIKDGTLRQLDIDMKRKGIQPNDPLWSRIIARSLSSFFDTSAETGSIWDYAIDKTYDRKQLRRQ